MRAVARTIGKIISILLLAIGIIIALGAFLVFLGGGNVTKTLIVAFVALFVISIAVALDKYLTRNGNSEEKSIDNWEEIFHLIEKAGGIKLPGFKGLTSQERKKVRINWLAFIFGPIYYLSKGMWKKTITYGLLMSLFILLIKYIALHYFGKNDIRLSGVAFGAIWGVLANIDYYKIKVLGEDKWI
ncbi:MAG: DUF2628 domain-containing protein [Methyloglobulus sp.]|nr:DUF2628 domain-containing protein [Methyloglobulus sp.]